MNDYFANDVHPHLTGLPLRALTAVLPARSRVRFAFMTLASLVVFAVPAAAESQSRSLWNEVGIVAALAFGS